MTRLLVSVRDAQEAQAALDGGADLVDVKEPLRGALGPADAGTIDAVVEAVAGCVPTSIALGELVDLDGRLDLPTRRVDYAKVGLARCAERPDWPRRWRRLVEQLPPETRRVAVVYADWETCGAPPPLVALREAVELGCAAMLVDTCDKSRGSLSKLWSAAELGRFLDLVRGAQLMTVVGGSLDAATISTIADLGPDYVAVRGAVCRGDRTARVEAELVERLASILSARVA